MSIWVIGKAVAVMKKKNVKYPYGKAVKVCEDCCTVDAGNIRKCRVCGGKMIKIEGIHLLPKFILTPNVTSSL